jgi:hypothetical protein
MGARAARPRASVTRARGLRARRLLPFAGVGLAWWDRKRRSSLSQGSAAPSRDWSAWQRRSLRPAVPRSRDMRCPSGSGWDRGFSQSPARVTARGQPRVDGWMQGKPCTRFTARERPLAAKHASSWPVKPRLVAVSVAGWVRFTSAPLRPRRMGRKPRSAGFLRARKGPPAREREPPSTHSRGRADSQTRAGIWGESHRSREPARGRHPSRGWRLPSSCEARTERFG